MSAMFSVMSVPLHKAYVHFPMSAAWPPWQVSPGTLRYLCIVQYQSTHTQWISCPSHSLMCNPPHTHAIFSTVRMLVTVLHVELGENFGLKNKMSAYSFLLCVQNHWSHRLVTSKKYRNPAEFGWSSPNDTAKAILPVTLPIVRLSRAAQHAKRVVLGQGRVFLANSTGENISIITVHNRGERTMERN